MPRQILQIERARTGCPNSEPRGYLGNNLGAANTRS